MNLRNLLCILIALFLSASSLVAQDVAKLYATQGEVEVKRLGSVNWEPVFKGASLAVGDEIRTKNKSRAGLKFNQGKLLRLRENSSLKIDDNTSTKMAPGIYLSKGTAHLFSRTKAEFPEVRTPEVSAAIRGTEFEISTSNDNTSITVVDGLVDMENQVGRLSLKKGEKGSSTKNGTPSKVVVLNPLESVQWAVQVPSSPALEVYQDLFTQEGLEEAFRLIKSGDYSGAQALITKNNSASAYGKSLIFLALDNPSEAEKAVQSIKSTDALNIFHQSAIALSAGEFSEAKSGLEKILTMNPSPELKSAAQSQLALCYLVANNLRESEKLCSNALQTSPTSIQALLNCSFVSQAQFKLDEALKYLDQALAIDPKNSFAAARKVELLLGTGELDNAMDLSVASLNDQQDYYALSVAGFSALTLGKVDQAKSKFNKAIELNNSAALPHLGLGLATIKSGELEEGRELLEQAVHLAPQISLYRSYLAKAYFEEEREDFTDKELEIAIDIDPKDPTPNLYRAFNRLSNNKVIPALEDVETSIAKNDNRAIYRSRLLLDQDLAVRTTSLAEVFNQLGFKRVARVEAIKSINKDYTNYSAHRLYADILEGNFFSDANYSENVIADILSPVSFNLFQGQRGFAGSASLNEYAALFDRPGSRTGIRGSSSTYQDQLSGSVYHSGNTGKFGYLVGLRNYYGLGRKSGGKYQRESNANIGLQYQIDFDNRILFQTNLNRNDDANYDDKFINEQASFTLSSQHRLSDRSNLIFSVDYFDSDINNQQGGTIRPVRDDIVRDNQLIFSNNYDVILNEKTKENADSLRYSAQHIYQGDLVRTIGGAQVFDSSLNGHENSPVLDDSGYSLPSQFVSNGSASGLSYASYLYSTWHIQPWLDIDLGGAYTDLELSLTDTSIPPFVDGTRHARKWLPKIGTTLTPVKSLTVRSAYFKNLSVANIIDTGSIEPTLLGGFSQVYFDLPGTYSENAGIGLDYKFPNQAYFGVEYLERKLDLLATSIVNVFTVNLNDLQQTTSFSADSLVTSENQEDFRAYAYFVLSDEFALTNDLIHIDIDRQTEQQHIYEDRFTTALKYFSPNRWYSFIQSRLAQQSNNYLTGSQSNDQVALIDAGIGYRFPKRHGVVQFIVNNIFDQNFDFVSLGRTDQLYPDLAFRLETQINF